MDILFLLVSDVSQGDSGWSRIPSHHQMHHVIQAHDKVAEEMHIVWQEPCQLSTSFDVRLDLLKLGLTASSFGPWAR